VQHNHNADEARIAAKLNASLSSENILAQLKDAGLDLSNVQLDTAAWAVF